MIILNISCFVFENSWDVLIKGGAWKSLSWSDPSPLIYILGLVLWLSKTLITSFCIGSCTMLASYHPTAMGSWLWTLGPGQPHVSKTKKHNRWWSNISGIVAQTTTPLIKDAADLTVMTTVNHLWILYPRSNVLFSCQFLMYPQRWSRSGYKKNG